MDFFYSGFKKLNEVFNVKNLIPAQLIYMVQIQERHCWLKAQNNSCLEAVLVKC
jgi:hypothetical protein